MTPAEAAQETLTRLHGAFALCFLFDGQDDLMIATRKGSPLAIGHGTGEMYVGSDAIALALRTQIPIWGADDLLDEAGIDIPDAEIPAEDEVEKFREFLDQVSPEDFGELS
jgi:hypothetical protein